MTNIQGRMVVNPRDSHWTWLALNLVLLWGLGAGCVFDESGLVPPDAASNPRPDGAGLDAAQPDGAPPDVAILDSATTDASLPDGAPPDASLPDAAPDAQIPTCGNGSMESGEDCDGSDLGGSTCLSIGGSGGVLACHSDCTLDVGGCWGCGNGVVDPAEQCDGLELDGATCGTLGFTAGVLSCASDCSFDTSYCRLCGNGLLEPGEPCDGAELGGADCLSQGFDGGNLGCTTGCAYDTSACTTCGDGLADPTEDCDGADLKGATCTSLGFHSGTLSCSSTCLFDMSGCAECGDSAVEGDEECDDGPNNSDTAPDTCRTNCTRPRCGDGVCDTPELGGLCPTDCSFLVLWEDFESLWPDQWTAGDYNDHWATGRDYWGRVTNRYHSATRSLWCAENGDDPWGGYDNNMDAWANRAVDLSPYAGQIITLSLWIWVHTNESDDYYRTRYSANGGSTWTTLETISGDSGGWIQKTYDLSGQAGNASFLLGLFFHSDGTNSSEEGAYVDDIRITAVR